MPTHVPRTISVLLAVRRLPALALNAILLEQGLRVDLAPSDADLLRLVRSEQPDILLIDEHLLLELGPAQQAYLAERASGVAILALCERRDPARDERLLRAGARGCISESDGDATILAMIRLLAEGEIAFDKRLLHQVAAKPATTTESLIPMGPRELELLQHLAHGSTVDQAASRMGISYHTARTHLRRAMTKMNSRTMLQAVVRAMELGLIERPEAPAAC